MLTTTTQEPDMPRLSDTARAIETEMDATYCIASFKVTQGRDTIRADYHMTDHADAIEDTDMLFDNIEDKYGLTMARSGANGDGYYITWTVNES